jgi:hypothetical protein
MPDAPRPPHPRALIRRAVVRVLLEHEATSALLGDRVFPNREEHWLQDELPAAGVYTLSEERIDSDVSPDPEERRLSLVVETLARMSARVDDVLDALTLAVETALSELDAVGEAMGAIVNESREAAGLDPLEKVPAENGDLELRWPCDTLRLIVLRSTDIGIAVDGDREIGAAAMNFDLEDAWPVERGEIADFLLGLTDWDVEPHDGVIDMVSRVEFEKE